MNEDMSNLINKFSSMLKNNEIPSELSNAVKGLSNKSNNNDVSSNSENLSTSGNSNNIDFSNINIDAIKKLFEQSNNNTLNNTNGNSNTANNSSNKNNVNTNTFAEENTTSSIDDNSSFNFDINTMLKMKSIIDAMNNQKNDPRANLLKSLKPYLKESRKEKVDQYIKIFSMEKVFEQFNPLGGDKKHDV